MTSTHTGTSNSGSKCAAISNHVVRTMSEYTGRGPTKARTHIHDNVVTVLLQDTLTKGERSLVGDELDGLVLTMRKAFQGTMGEDLVDGVDPWPQGHRVHERQPHRPGCRRGSVRARPGRR